VNVCSSLFACLLACLLTCSFCFLDRKLRKKHYFFFLFFLLMSQNGILSRPSCSPCRCSSASDTLSLTLWPCIFLTSFVRFSRSISYGLLLSCNSLFRFLFSIRCVLCLNERLFCALYLVRTFFMTIIGLLGGCKWHHCAVSCRRV